MGRFALCPAASARFLILPFVVRPLTALRQLFKPQLPPDLYVNFRVVLDRIIFTAIALHPTVSGPVAAMRNMRDRHVSATSGSWIGRTMYAAAQECRVVTGTHH